MTLVEHLAKTGVDLDKIIGFIVEYYDVNGERWAEYARIGRLCLSLPEEVMKYEELQDFDTSHCLMIQWKVEDLIEFYILRMPENATLYEVNEGGIIIDSPESRICIGQTNLFMDNVCEIWCALENKPVH